MDCAEASSPLTIILPLQAVLFCIFHDPISEKIACQNLNIFLGDHKVHWSIYSVLVLSFIVLVLLIQLIKQAQEYQKQCEILTKQEAEMKSQVNMT